VPLAGHGLRPPLLRPRAGRPQLKRNPLGAIHPCFIHVLPMRLSWLLSLALACTARGDGLPSEAVVTPIKVADFPGYSEGIVFDAAGTAYASVGRNPDCPHAVYRLQREHPPVAWVALRIPNGHKVLRDGSHVIAAEGVIVHVAPTGRVLDSLTTAAVGEHLRRPNDIALDGHGGFYFTDPGLPDSGSHNGKLFYADSVFRIALVTGGFCYPNGLVVRVDGRLLYLDDNCNGRVYRIPIVRPGVIGRPAVLATIPDSTDAGLDGMTLDEAGRIYIAHNGVGRVEVLDTLGRLLRRYQAGNLLASNVAFGGPTLGDLYVTGSPGAKSGPGALFRLHLGVRGRSSSATPAP